MVQHDDLEAPLMLVAMPQVVDPFFHRSLILLVHHDEEGSVGFIVNRPTGLAVPEILAGMKIDWGGRGEEVACFGGPVQPQLGTVLFAGNDPDEGGADGDGAARPGSTLVCPGVRMTQHVDDLAALAAAPPARFRLILGYAGWGAGQLEEEILRNDWLIARPEGRLVFAEDPAQAWQQALAALGVDPAALPSWSPGPDEEAN